MLVIFFAVPVMSFLLLVLTVGLNDLIVAIGVFLGGLIIIGPFVYFKNRENASIVIENNTLTNYMNDGTANFGWTEEIEKIKRIEITDGENAKKYYKNCRAKKVLLLDFGSYNIKYISVGLFTDNQIKKILECLQKEIRM